MLKYLIHYTNINMERWENGSMWLFYVETCAGLLRLFFYLIFFLIIFSSYGLPLHLIRELGMTLLQFKDTLRKFRAYRAIVKDLRERCPNASPEELAERDTCAICQDTMPPDDAKRLPCGHIFHFYCLRSWLEHSVNNVFTCPMCRAVIPPGGGTQRPPVVPEAKAREAGERRAGGQQAEEGKEPASAGGAAPSPGSQRPPASRPHTQPPSAQRPSSLPPPHVLPSLRGGPPAGGGGGGGGAPRYQAPSSTPPLPLPPAGLPPPMIPIVLRPLPDARVPLAQAFAMSKTQTVLLQQHIAILEAQLAQVRGLHAAQLDFQQQVLATTQREAKQPAPPGTESVGDQKSAKPPGLVSSSTPEQQEQDSGKAQEAGKTVEAPSSGATGAPQEPDQDQ